MPGKKEVQTNAVLAITSDGGEAIWLTSGWTELEFDISCICSRHQNLLGRKMDGWVVLSVRELDGIMAQEPDLT